MTLRGHPPLINKTSAPFWDALRREQIVLQHCQACGHWVFYPRIFCTNCESRELAWETVSGEATLYSFTVAEKPVSVAFRHRERDVLAIVQLKEGVRLPSTIVHIDPDAVRIGMRLEPVFDHDSYDNATLLRFMIAKSSGKGLSSGGRPVSRG